MSNVLHIQTGKPVRGTSTISDVFLNSLPPVYHSFIQARLSSSEMCHVTVVYGWALRWSDALGLNIHAVKAWHERHLHGSHKYYRDDALFELHNLNDVLNTALTFDWTRYGVLAERLKRNVRILRDDLESIAHVYPHVTRSLKLVDQENGLERIPRLARGVVPHLDLVRRQTPHAWWGSA